MTWYRTAHATNPSQCCETCFDDCRDVRVMVTPASSMIPRSRRVDTGFTAVLPIRTARLGIWCWRRVDEIIGNRYFTASFVHKQMELLNINDLCHCGNFSSQCHACYALHSVHSSVCMFLCSVCLLGICLSVSLLFCLFIHLSVLCAWMSVCLSIHLYRSCRPFLSLSVL